MSRAKPKQLDLDEHGHLPGPAAEWALGGPEIPAPELLAKLPDAELVKRAHDSSSRAAFRAVVVGAFLADGRRRAEEAGVAWGSWLTRAGWIHSRRWADQCLAHFDQLSTQAQETYGKCASKLEPSLLIELLTQSVKVLGMGGKKGGKRKDEDAPPESNASEGRPPCKQCGGIVSPSIEGQLCGFCIEENAASVKAKQEAKRAEEEASRARATADAAARAVNSVPLTARVAHPAPPPQDEPQEDEEDDPEPEPEPDRTRQILPAAQGAVLVAGFAELIDFVAACRKRADEIRCDAARLGSDYSSRGDLCGRLVALCGEAERWSRTWLGQANPQLQAAHRFGYVVDEESA